MIALINVMNLDATKSKVSPIPVVFSVIDEKSTKKTLQPRNLSCALIPIVTVAPATDFLVAKTSGNIFDADICQLTAKRQIS
jgi:hypothetical protein